MFANDNEQEFNDAFIAHRSQLHHTAQKILRSRELAEEVVQEAYLKVVEIAKNCTIKQPVAYFFQIVRNLSIDYYRRSSIEATLFSSEEDNSHYSAIATGTPETIAITRENLLLLDKVLGSLPERTRKAFEWYRLGGHTQRDIAEMLGVSTTLVNFMIRDASEALGRCRHLLQRE